MDTIEWVVVVGAEKRQEYSIAQIYVQSEDRTEEEHSGHNNHEDQAYDNLGQEFSMQEEITNSSEELKREISEDESINDYAYKSVCHFYRKQLFDDTTSCNRVPSLLQEITASLVTIATIIFAYLAFHEVIFEATGVQYKEFQKDEEQDIRSFSNLMNYKTIHIYKEPVFLNWRNFAYLGLSLTILEILAPVLRFIVVINRAPKRINTLHTLVQIIQLTCLILEDGAISLCKNMLFAEECGIREPMMSPISQISASLSLVNTVIKTALFVWRSSYRTQRAIRDEMEAYTEILILEDYQWYHCILPILAHITIVCISIWSLVISTDSNLLCDES